MNLYQKYFKNLLDKTCSVFLLICFSPLIFLISIIQFTIYGKDIFFLQERSGLNGRVFQILKFRTMKDKYDENGMLLPDNLRLTHFGRLLRFLSFDELLNLVNVFRGEMSFVGPRPFPKTYLAFMNDEQRRRYSVRPGITGLAQVNGRNKLSWGEKISFDLQYVRNVKFLLDLGICIRSLKFLFTITKNRELGNQSFDNFTPDFD